MSRPRGNVPRGNAPRGNAPRGRGRGAPARGGSLVGSAGSAGASSRVPAIAEHITTIGVKRADFGTSGRPLPVFVNSFVTSIPSAIIHHYDGKHLIAPSEKTLPARLNLDLITAMQKSYSQIFTPPGVYDGRKNLFAARELPFGGSSSQEFSVSLSDSRGESAGASGKGPKVYKIRLTKVAEINPEVLERFVEGKQSHDNTVLTAITALNVIIRMEPTLKYPFNVRSFFTDKETKPIGAGIVLWRGYFQSVRPASGRMLINVDISTGTMYKPGPLIGLILEFLGRDDPNVLSPARGLPDRERLRIQRHISGIRVVTVRPGAPQQSPRVLKKLSAVGASSLRFKLREGGEVTVADYFKKTQNGKSLRFPDLLCAEVGSGALLPLELCIVPPGQIMRKQVPAEKTKDVLDFATKRPLDRLNSIRNGIDSVLNYGQSEYIRQFGMDVSSAEGPLKINARVLKPPELKYGQGSKQLTITPSNGAWNMVDKKFYRPVTIERYVIVVYERQNRFGPGAVDDLVKGLSQCCREVGINITPDPPVVKWANGQGRIADQLKEAGAECAQKYKGGPKLIVVVLPEGGNDIYTAVKHFGDITMGVATQCLKSNKCFRAKPQYYANVCLKINVKLGGINLIPNPASVSVLTDPNNPTIVMGADVIHPAPGSDGRPSFTALVANVDTDNSKYIAASRVQTSRQEMIEDLQSMAKHVLTMYTRYRGAVEKRPHPAPKRIIFYRDGVSEGQFKQVLEQELPLIKAACAELKINPTITVIVVGKRHHVRFFPQNERDADRSGNCPAGTVVDREVSHPTEFDFYLQSHAGLLGTSRPAHYSILHDENNFGADALQSLSFALCHVYARSTRSVSIPAPVYYADIVCSRAKNHYDPSDSFDFSDSATNTDSVAANNSLDIFKRGFKELHPNQSTLMYFS